MALPTVVQKAVAVSLALIALTVAFVAGTGSSATATQGQAVIAGQTNTETSPTVFQNTDIGDGIQGQGGTAGGSSGVYGVGHSGVSGDGSTFGVVGTGPTGVLGTSSTAGNGVWGRTGGASLSGVYGENFGTGSGVTGHAPDGTGVLARSANGTALQVRGTLMLSRSGEVIVSTGQRYIQVALTDLVPKTFIIATVQGGRSGVWVQRVAISPANGYFRIYLNTTAASDTRVGWFAIH
jgi:hypothetical protein